MLWIPDPYLGTVPWIHIWDPFTCPLDEDCTWTVFRHSQPKPCGRLKVLPPPGQHMKPLGASVFAQQSQGFANVVFLMPHLQTLKRAKTVRTYQGFRPSAPQMNPLGGL